MNRLHELRAEKNFMKQEDLAKLLNVDISTISRYETSKSKMVNIDLENRICDFFGCSLDYLRGRSNIRNEAEYSKNLQKVADMIINFYASGKQKGQELSDQQLAQFETFIMQFKELFKTLSISRNHH